MSEIKIVKFRRDAANPPKADWARVDALSEDELEQAALADPDAKPLSDEQLAGMRRIPDVLAIRTKMALSIDEFAARFGLSAVLIREWEEHRRVLDPAAKLLLRIIEREPEIVARVAAE